MRTAHLRRLYVFQWPPDVGEEGGPQVNMFEQVFGDMSQVQGVGPGTGGSPSCDVTSRGRGSLSSEVPSPQGGGAGVALSSEVPCLDCGSLVTTGPIDENQS